MVVSLNSYTSTMKPIGNFQHGPILERNHYTSPSGQVYYQPHYTSSGNGHQKEGNKKSVALTALTLLAFLFFLHILQNCLQEQMEMNQNNGQQVLVLSRLKTHRDADKRKDEVGDDDTIDVDDSESDDASENGEKTYLKIAKRRLVDVERRAQSPQLK